MPLITFILLCAEVALLIKLGQAVGGGLVLVEILVSGLLGVGLLRLAGRNLFEPSRLIELLVRRPNLRSANPTASLMYAGILL
ncbi:FxsA family protein, partial [Candidatus Bipolaricaulota bacterium]|nr:FxsA family protein [Candidatus Bipolaricaulota bacterium]